LMEASPKMFSPAVADVSSYFLLFFKEFLQRRCLN